MKKPVLLGIVFVVVILGVIIYSSMSMAGHRVEVCITFNGHTNCRTASGSTEDYARRTATSNACAEMASGVTESMACERTEPDKVTLLK
ncbi:MAG: hypothetical protein ABL995_05395 [Bryobacteraceae bacterium]